MASLEAGFAVLDRDGTIRAVNPTWQRFASQIADGEGTSAQIGTSYLDFVRSHQGESGGAPDEGMVCVLEGKLDHVRRVVRWSGPPEMRWIELCLRRMSRGRFMATYLDVTERKRNESFTALQHELLAQIATGSPLAGMLEQIAHAVEEQLPALFCSILRLEGQHLRLGAAPSLPPSYNSAIDGIAIGPSVGSCGTAAYRHQRVIVTDIATDPLWADFSALALGHGLRACWSFPIFPTRPNTSTPEVLGAFAFYSRVTGGPDAWAERVAKWASHLASIALELDGSNRALRESERRFQTLAKSSPVGIFRTDSTGACVYVNPRWCAIAGLTAETALTNEWSSAIHEADRPLVFAAWTDAVANVSAYHLEYRFATRDGTVTWVLGQAEPERDDEGALVGFVGTITDISARKRTELELLASTERHRTLARATNDAIWDWDLASNRVWWNEGLTTLFGYAIQPAVAEPAWWVARIHPEERAAVEARFFAVVHGLELTWESEYRFLRADGTYADVFDRGHVLRDEHGMAHRIIGAMMDISRQKRAEGLLRELNRDLEQRVEARTAELAAANQELESFSYSVSHDLRAPLRAIDGFSRIVLEDYGASLPKEATDYLEEVRNSSRRMAKLIDELLAFSRLSRQVLERQSLDTRALVATCISELQAIPEAGEKRRMEVTIAPDLPVSEGDPNLLKQVWLNLLANAMKYSKKRDPAHIEVGFLPAVAPTTFFVRDNGVGFDMRYAHKLFGVFQRLHRAEDYEGSGVGLAIVHRVIHRHGGRVWAEAEPNRGATFFFSLPSQGAT